MISGRHVAALLVVFVLALLPTVRHGYMGQVDAAPKVEASQLPAELNGRIGATETRAGSYVGGIYAADSWAERRYDLAGGGQINLIVIRGFDMKKLYHHPELGVLRGRSFDPVQTVQLASGGEPVHVLRNVGTGESAVYTFVYQTRWIGNPYLLQLSSAVTSLWHGRQPLTLVFAYGDVLDGRAPAAATDRLLREAVARLTDSPLVQAR
jgi:hypothetical protein